MENQRTTSDSTAGKKSENPFDGLLKRIDDWNQSVARLIPSAPYCWAVNGTCTMFFGETAEDDAKQEAARIGGTASAFPLFRKDRKD